MKKRLLALFLSVALCAGLTPVSALPRPERPDRPETAPVSDLPVEEDTLPSQPAAVLLAEKEGETAPLASGDCGTKVKWSLSGDGVLSITGTGAMRSYSSDSVTPWVNLRNTITAVTVEQGVTTLGKNAFAKCPRLAAVTLPDGLTEIGEAAFNGCAALGDVQLPDSLLTIGKNAFKDCVGLSQVVVPDKVTTVNDSAFSGCTGLTSLTLGAGVKNVYNNAFSGCAGLTGVYVADPDTWCAIAFSTESSNPLSITHRLYAGDQAVTRLVVPEGVTAINTYAFAGWSELTRLTLPASLTAVRGYAFKGCTGLQDVFTSEEDRDGVSIEAAGNGNRPLTDAYWHYNYQGGTVIELAVAPSQHGQIDIPACACPGEVLPVKAVPQPGYKLKSLTADHGQLGEVALVIPADADFDTVTLTAVFEPIFPGLTIVDSGECGDDINWIYYDSGLLYLSGFGLMTDFSSAASVPWKDYNAAITAVTIEEGITNLGKYAFSKCTALTQVCLPASISVVGTYAFSDCSNLGCVEFLGNAPTDGFGAMAFCLTTNNKDKKPPAAGQLCIYYHAGTTGWDAAPTPDSPYPQWHGFYIDCLEALPKTDLSTLNEDGRNSQGILFTLNEDSLTARVGDNSATLNNSAYYGAAGGVVIIPDTVTFQEVKYRVDNIGQNAFAGNKTVREVRLGKNVRGLLPSSFQDTSNLSLFTVDAENGQYHQADGVLYDTEGLYLYVYPAKKEGEHFIVPETVKTVGSNAFRSNPYLKEVSVSEEVTTIGPEAFYGCTSLAKLTLPFLGGSALDTNPFPYIFSKTNAANAVPASLVEVVITGEELCDKAFQGCTHLRRITLPSLSTVPANSFYNCQSLVALRITSHPDLDYQDGLLLIPDNLEKIGNAAFQGCAAFTALRIGANIETIGDNAFNACTGLTTASVSTGTVSLGNAAFQGCVSLRTAAFSAGLTTIGNNAFKDCVLLEDMVIPEGVKTLGNSAFQKCASLPAIVLPDSVTSIGSSCFAGCSGAVTATVGKGLATMGRYAFDDCLSLQAFQVSEDNRKFASDKWGVLFDVDMNILYYYPASRIWPYYNVPKTAVTIGEKAFQHCTGLSNLYIPKTTREFKDKALDPTTGTIYCVYKDTPADLYVVSQGLTAWYMNNNALNDIEIYALPKCTALPLGSEELSGLYLVANYSGQILQLDDYTVEFGEIDSRGLQTATVTYDGFSASFQLLRYDAATQTPISFGALTAVPEGALRLAPVYQGHRMLSIQSAVTVNDETMALVPKDHAQVMDAAVLYQLDPTTLALLATPVEGKTP